MKGTSALATEADDLGVYPSVRVPKTLTFRGLVGYLGMLSSLTLFHPFSPPDPISLAHSFVNHIFARPLDKSGLSGLKRTHPCYCSVA